MIRVHLFYSFLLYTFLRCFNIESMNGGKNVYANNVKMGVDVDNRRQNIHNKSLINENN